MAESVGRQQSGKQSAGKQQTGEPEAARTKTAVPETTVVDFAMDSNNYVNRELGWLGFNCRVFNEARGKTPSLSERLKFPGITTSSLDEFYMVRVVSLKGMAHAKHTKPDTVNLTPQEQLDQISEKTHQLVDMRYSIYNHSPLPALKASGLQAITEREELSENEIALADEYPKKNVYPILTPTAFDSSRPFLLIRNKALNIAALLRKKRVEQAEEGLEFAVVQVPSVISRIVELPRKVDGDGKEQRVVILLEGIIERDTPVPFLNYGIVVFRPFRIMRNVDLTIDEEKAVDLLEEIRKQLKGC